MICPNCGKFMKNNFCICCGFMENGNFIHKTYEKSHSDLELYLGNNYQKIIRNDTWLLTFLLGPLYLCFRNFFFIGFCLEIINILLFFCFAYIGAAIQVSFFNLAIPFMIIYLLLSKTFWMTVDNMIYVYLIKNKIRKLKYKYGIQYQQIILNKKNDSNILLPILSLFVYFLILFLVIYFYRLYNGTL